MRIRLDAESVYLAGQANDPMSEPHQIRIRGPYSYRLASGEQGSIKLPAAWEKPGENVVFSRRFNWLAELEPNERVYLVFDGYGGSGPVSVNGIVLGDLTSGPAEFEVTELLQPGNELEVSLSFHEPADRPRGLWGHVMLEVRTAGV
jgi:hypothetical protein